MADDPRLAALAAAIHPWMVMPTGGGHYAGALWTPEEQAAYDAAGGWGSGIAAARTVRAVQAARDALAALDDGGPDAWEWGVQRTLGGRPGPSWRDTARCADAAHAQRAAAGGGLTVVRRRPAGPWEPAPAGQEVP